MSLLLLVFASSLTELFSFVEIKVGLNTGHNNYEIEKIFLLTIDTYLCYSF